MVHSVDLAGAKEPAGHSTGSVFVKKNEILTQNQNRQ